MREVIHFAIRDRDGISRRKVPLPSFQAIYKLRVEGDVQGFSASYSRCAA